MRIRPLTLALTLVPMISALVTACSSDSNEQIEGTWRDTTTGVYLEYGANDEYSVAVTGDLTNAFEWWTYTFEDDTLTQATAPDSDVCPDTSATWTVEFSDDGNQADLTFVEDSCVPATRSQDLVLTRQ